MLNKENKYFNLILVTIIIKYYYIIQFYLLLSNQGASGEMSSRVYT